MKLHISHAPATVAALLAIVAAFAPSHAQAQVAPNPGATLRSCEVLPDGKVVFRIYAPKASEVTVSGDWVTQGLGTGGTLQKDAQGVWSIAVGPLPPDVYTYTFTVDGVRTLDPRNPRSQFIDLDNRKLYSASDVFKRVYTGSHHLVLQTCIQKGYIKEWGRVFIIAEPKPMSYPPR